MKKKMHTRKKEKDTKKFTHRKKLNKLHTKKKKKNEGKKTTKKIN